MTRDVTLDAHRTDPPPAHAGTIEVSLDTPDALFHAFDPSPLVARDLDDEVEAWIVESARELPHRAYRLIIHIAEETGTPANHQALAQAIRNYFLYRRDVQARRLRLLMREGRQALALGLGFLILCSGLGFAAMRLVPAPFGGFLNEGLLIIGWVANWRPVEIFLYDWRPMRRQRDIYDALGHMQINIRPAAQ